VIRDEGHSHSMRIGDAVDFEIEDVVPAGVETGDPARIVGIFHPAGSAFNLAETARSRISALVVALLLGGLTPA
jgi:hypothetical protein